MTIYYSRVKRQFQLLIFSQAKCEYNFIQTFVPKNRISCHNKVTKIFYKYYNYFLTNTMFSHTTVKKSKSTVKSGCDITIKPSYRTTILSFSESSDNYGIELYVRGYKKMCSSFYNTFLFFLPISSATSTNIPLYWLSQ